MPIVKEDRQCHFPENMAGTHTRIVLELVNHVHPDVGSHVSMHELRRRIEQIRFRRRDFESRD